MEHQETLYSEAYKRGIITKKDFIRPYNDVFIDNDGFIIDNVIKVFHEFDSDSPKEKRLVGFYFPDSYKSIKIYFNINIGLNSALKYFNGLCFNIGFLNKEKDFNELLNFCILASRYIFDKYKIAKREEHISDLITMGLETETTEYNFTERKMKKFYFTDASLSPKERQNISLINSNKFRRNTNREKIESAIEALMELEHFVGHKDIADLTGLDLATISRNLTEEDKDRIKFKNIETTGFPTPQEYTKSLNIDLVIDSILRLRSKKKKTTSVNISKDISENTTHQLHRVTVSKILKEEPIIKEI